MTENVMAERNMDTGMRIIMEKLENHLNDYRLKKKLQMLYIFCVLFPLVVTDGVILYDLIRLERQRQQYEMEMWRAPCSITCPIPWSILRPRLRIFI